MQWLMTATLMSTVIANSQVAAAGIRAVVLSNSMSQQHSGPDPDADNWEEADLLLRNAGGGLDKEQIFEQG